MKTENFFCPSGCTHSAAVLYNGQIHILQCLLHGMTETEKTHFLSIFHCQKARTREMSFHHGCCYSNWSPVCTSLRIIADQILGSPAAPLPAQVPVISHHSQIAGRGAPQLTSKHFPHLLSQAIRSHSLGQKSEPISCHYSDSSTRVPSDLIAVYTGLYSAALLSHSLWSSATIQLQMILSHLFWKNTFALISSSSPCGKLVRWRASRD